MNFKEIQELIKLISRSDLAEFKMKDSNFELSIRTKYYGASRQPAFPVVNVPPTVVAAPVSAEVPAMPTAAPAPDVQTPKAAPAPKSDKQYLEIKSPIVGTFYRSPSPERGPYVKVGDSVKAGDVVCIVEAMKLFNEIESEISGTIVKVMVEDAQPVEYDQVLFLVEP